MNRPSRNDDTAEHPTWNQSPPDLAADLTTCEDLKGMANAREYRSGNGIGDADEGIGTMMVNPVSARERAVVPPGSGADGRLSLGQRSKAGSCPLPKETMAYCYGNYSVPASAAAPSVAIGAPSPLLGRRSKAALSWATWILSVVSVSILLNYLSIPAFFSGWSSESQDHHPSSVSQDRIPSTIDPSFLSASAFANPATGYHHNVGSPVSSSLLTKRTSTCGTGQPIAESEYNTPLHVGALIIILTVSSLACAFSIIMKKMPRFKIPPNFFFGIRHFGTGVLIATAFVHLLPTAFTYLADPCLSGFWTEDYPAMPGAIALAGIFFVTLIEMVFSPHRHINQDGGVIENMQEVQEMGRAGIRRASRAETIRNGDESAIVDDSDIDMESTTANPRAASRPEAESGPVRDLGPLRGRSLSISRQLSRVGGRPGASAISKPEMIDIENAHHGHHHHEGGRIVLTPEQQHNKDILQCMMLEMGILFHSVFIGMALSVSVGKEFIVLLIAIAFHQSFEGLALGARIAAIDWPEKTWQPWIMAFAYGCTTPIGQAIGLGVHGLYDPASELGLVLVGTMNAISSGLLVFASLVELLSEDFLSDESWRALQGKRRVVACLLVLAGAFGMSFVGAWA
ncbi:hypothetical protein MKZ38_001876 [Zalerion maritima]|uniref:Uncharacterized protein n=1 Tax=Zalerion maritima TaxID=339359 RepID=A0AAD5RR61_9PEZI|nr:hypothetical protein MKZ38_001876 [Zalerion maritima]